MIDKDIKNYLETLEASLKKKEELLSILLHFTKEQEELLRKEELEAERFEKVIEEKAKVIEEVNLLDEGFDSVFHLIREEVLATPHKFRPILETMKERIRALMDKSVELEALERRNQLRMEFVLSRDRTKIKQFHVNNGAAAKYYSNMVNGGEPPNLFLDKKK